MTFGTTPETLFVTDTNCFADPESPNHVRSHQIPFDGIIKTFTFHYGKSLEMPFAHAMKFLVDEAFQVSDETGKLYKPVPKAETDGAQGLVLRQGQVIARLDELLKDALLARCAIAPGGEAIKSRASREEMIEFLEGIDAETLAANTEADEGVEPGADTAGMSQADVDAMMPKPDVAA